MRFRNGHKKKLDSVIIEMKKVIKEKKILKRIYIITIYVNNIRMSDIRTNQQRYIWDRYQKKCTSISTRHLSGGLTQGEIEQTYSRKQIASAYNMARWWCEGFRNF